MLVGWVRCGTFMICPSLMSSCHIISQFLYSCFLFFVRKWKSTKQSKRCRKIIHPTPYSIFQWWICYDDEFHTEESHFTFGESSSDVSKPPTTVFLQRDFLNDKKSWRKRKKNVEIWRCWGLRSLITSDICETWHFFLLFFRCTY